MEYFTKRNTAILALVQGGVLVAGVLAACVDHKWYTVANVRPPTPTALLAEYGFLALVLPLVWVTIALRVQQRNEDADSKALVFGSGILLLLLLLLGIGYAVVLPFVRLMGCGGLSS
jgi:hypothetical protein